MNRRPISYAEATVLLSIRRHLGNIIANAIFVDNRDFALIRIYIKYKVRISIKLTNAGYVPHGH